MEGYSEFRIRIRFMLLSTLHVYPYNKTRHSYIYMLPIDGWVEWAEIFCGHSCLKVKNREKKISNFFFHGQRRDL